MRQPLSLISGPDPVAATDRGFAWAVETADNHPNSVLCLTQNRDRAETITRRWESSYDPLRLTVETLDEFVGLLYEQATGTLSTSILTRAERYRLVEGAIEQYDSDSGPFTGIEHPSNDLIDQIQGLFSLLEYADYASPEAIETALRSAGQYGDRGIAPELFGSFRTDTPPVDGGPLEAHARVFSRLYAQYTRIRRQIYPDWKIASPEQYLHLLDKNLLVDTFPETVEAVIIDGLTRLAPTEREVIARIARTVPTVVVIPLTHESISGTGIDAGIEGALEVYWAIGFDLDYELTDTGNEDRLAAIRQLRVHSSNELTYQSTDVGLEWLSPSTKREEIRTVARRVRAILDRDDVDSIDIGIVVTDRTVYRGVLEEVLSAYDVPFTFTNGIGIEQTLVGDAVLSLLNLAQQESVLTPIRALCSNPLTSLESFGVNHSSVLRASNNATGNSLKELVDALQEADERDVADGIIHLVNAVVATSTSLEEYVEGIDSILEEMGLEQTVDQYSTVKKATGSLRPAYEAASYESVTAVLSSLKATAPYLSDTNPAQRVRRAVQAELVQGPPHQPGYVRVLPLAEAEMASFDHLFVLGLTSEYFPREQDTMAFFGQVNDADEEFTRAHTGRRAQYILGTLLTGSSDVVLSTPRYTVDGSEHVPAPFITELQRYVENASTVDGSGNLGLHLVTPEDSQREFASWAVQERFTSLDRPIEALSIADTLSADSRATAARGCLTAWRRSKPELTAHDAQIDIENLPIEGREAHSPSALEDYARCPFVFMMRRLLGFKDEYGDEDDISRANRGTYVHDVLAAFYRNFRDGQYEPVHLERVERETLEGTLLTEALDHLDDLGDIETPFARRTVTRLLAGLGTPETNPFYGPEGGAEREGLFARFLTQEYDRSGDVLTRPTYFEVAVDASGENVESLRDTPVSVATPNGDVSLRGIADRVDIAFGDSRGFHVRDYKTGRTPLRKDVTHGTQLQIPLYGLVLEHVLEEVTGEPHEMLGGSYYGLKAPNEIDPIASQIASRDAVDDSNGNALLAGPSQVWRLPFDSQDEFSQFIREVTPTRLGQIATAIENGAYQPTLLSSSQANCEDCTFKKACDIRHHHRRDTIDLLDRDHHYVSERADDEDFDLATYTDGAES